MSNSHLLGLITFGISALFAVLAWVFSSRDPIAGDPVMRRRARLVALLFPVLGLVLGYCAFAIDNRLAVTTLYEVMVEGSVGVEPGTPAPVRSVVFTVEHPGVEHDLLVSPSSKLFQSAGSPVDVSFSLHSSEGEVLIPERVERFDVSGGGSRRKRDWDGKNFHFTPAVAGPHTLRVTPLTVGIPRVHLRVADPLKRDGKRMSGY